MTEEEIKIFNLTGRGALTALDLAIYGLRKWASAFEARGGAAVFGNDAGLIALINNKVQATITPDDLATLARLRTDV